ncbi:MAG: diguanylate cyclase [Candidatus Thiodiazotropha sp. (ex Myrtea spinifera)]|nr:diguanylate cyclase [Candidatus Thiodiazotropha sp. (ex Myrtea spinifera)]
MIFRSRYRYLIIFLIFAILTPLLFWSSTHITRQQGLTDLAVDAENDLMLFARQLEQRLIGYDHLSGSISTSRQILAALRNPHDKVLVSTVNQYLEALNEEVHANAIYVMDLEGNTLAASNWQLKKSFVGKNYSFRPYFQHAMEGSPGRDVAVGATSGVLGYYVARPVLDADQIVGVVVVKVTLEEMRLLFADLDLRLLVADRDGVIFLASHDSWRFKTLRQVTSSKHEAIRQVRRYADEPLRLWPIEEVEDWNGVSKLVILDDGEEYLSQATLLLSRGWEMHVFKPTYEVDEHVYFAMVVSGLVSALALLLVLFLMQRFDYLQDLREAAIHDYLTGLYTRRYMQDAARAQISRINRGQINNFSAAMIDIDHFKQVNDQYGHRAGDQVLRAVGKAISSEIRRGDIPVRYGGEEFLVIINTHSDCDASRTVSRILSRIKTMHFRGPIRKLNITASAGIAHFQQDETLEDLLHRADELLYRAKQDGRDRFFDDECDMPKELQ